MKFSDQDTLAINAIRMLSVDMIEKAASGHPGLPLGCAPFAYVLWSRHLKHNPKDPHWPDRDRFIISAGHGSALLYSLLHLWGYPLPISELERFRQWDSLTPGHPEYAHTPGVEATTGPLGQGSANAVGFAIAEAHLRAQTPDTVDHFTYALVSDGDLMEGISNEAASLAGHLGLGRLIYLYDANDITLDGPTTLSFSEDVAARYQALGWHVEIVPHADHDLEAIDAAISQAKAETQKPSLILLKTTIGFGAPKKAGSASAHGSPLGKEERAGLATALKWNHPPFEIPDEIRQHISAVSQWASEKYQNWKKRTSDAPSYSIQENWSNALPSFQETSSLSTRKASEAIIQTLAQVFPNWLAGDADLSKSTCTLIAEETDFHALKNPVGRNLRYGVREHAMAAIANGIAYHGGLRTHHGTFFCFSDYMRPSLRLAAMNKLPVVCIWTHDSIGVGEDGPTHQPIEHLAALRCLPGFQLLRPADANETREAWKLAVETLDRPTGIVLTRQNLPVFSGEQAQKTENLKFGAYILQEGAQTHLDLILIATGSEVSIALKAQETLEKEHDLSVRVVSMPSWDLFERQSDTYKEEILPTKIKNRISIEAACSFGWSKWVGEHGTSLSIDHFGASAPGETLFEKFGITISKTIEESLRIVGAVEKKK